MTIKDLFPPSKVLSILPSTTTSGFLILSNIILFFISACVALIPFGGLTNAVNQINQAAGHSNVSMPLLIGGVLFSLILGLFFWIIILIIICWIISFLIKKIGKKIVTLWQLVNSFLYVTVVMFVIQIVIELFVVILPNTILEPLAWLSKFFTPIFQILSLLFFIYCVYLLIKKAQKIESIKSTN